MTIRISLVIALSDKDHKNLFSWLNVGDTSTTKEAFKEVPRQYKLRRNVTIRSHLYRVNNMLIFTKKFNNLSLEDIYIRRLSRHEEEQAHEDRGVTP